MSILKHYTSSGREYAEGAPMGEMVVNVKDYGAVGGAVSSDGPAFQRAIAALGQLWWGSGGGAAYGEARTGACLYIPSGYYVLTGYEFTIPSSVTIRGDGHGSTFLIWDADLGAGHAAITTYAGQREATIIEGVTIYGPQRTTIQTPGVRALDMDGVVAKSWCHMHECYVTGFGNNIVLDGDHQKFSEVRAERGYYNVYFDARSSSNFGDQSFEHCMFDGAGFANIAVAPDSMMNHVTMDSVHLGFAPYGLYKEGTTGTEGFMIDCVLDNVQFEDQGNGYILDESTGSGNNASSFIGNKLNGCIGRLVSYYKIAARDDDYGVKVRTASNSHIHSDNAWGGLYPGDIASIHITNGSITVYGGSPVKLFSPNGDTSGGLNWGNSVGSGQAFKTNTDCVFGDIMQRHTSGHLIQRYDPAYPDLPFVGIAAADAAAGEVVCVVNQGAWYVLSETVTAGGVWITPNGGGVGRRGQGVAGFLYPGTTDPYPAIAISRTSGGASGGASLPVTVLGPGGLRPTGMGGAGAWHSVGGGGEPAFLNSWVNHGSYQALRFCKDTDGVVTIQGCIKDGTNVNPVFTLPSGYRPPANLAFPLVAYHTSDARLGILRVHSDGNVYPETVDGDVAQVWINATFRV